MSGGTIPTGTLPSGGASLERMVRRLEGLRLQRAKFEVVGPYVEDVTESNDEYAHEPVQEVVGLPGFEPGSIAPKATSIDQTNPQAPCRYK